MTLWDKILKNEYVKGVILLALSSVVTFGVTAYRKHERDKIDREKQILNDSVQNNQIRTLYKLLDKKLDKNVFEQWEIDHSK